MPLAKPTLISAGTVCTMSIWGWLQGGVKGSGQVTDETREVDDFRAVELQGSGQLRIEQDEGRLLRIEAEDNVLPQIETRVEKGKLIISRRQVPRKERVHATQPVICQVTVPTLRSIEITGSGNATCAEIETESLTLAVRGSGKIDVPAIRTERLAVNVSGSGSFRLGGKATSFSAHIAGSGSIDANGLACTSADTRISGSGKIRVHVTEELKAGISGNGRIEYTGSPRVDSKVTGVGKIVRVEK